MQVPLAALGYFTLHLWSSCPVHQKEDATYCFNVRRLRDLTRAWVLSLVGCWKVFIERVVCCSYERCKKSIPQTRTRRTFGSLWVDAASETRWETKQRENTWRRHHKLTKISKLALITQWNKTVCFRQTLISCSYYEALSSKPWPSTDRPHSLL